MSTTIVNTREWTEDQNELYAIDYEELNPLNELVEELNNLVQRYESRYNTVIHFAVLAGKVGRWNGNFVGGKPLNLYYGPFHAMPSCTDYEAHVEEDGILTFIGHHHDASHEMHIYLMTTNQLKKMNVPDDSVGWGPDEFATVFHEGKPLKADKKFKEYYGIKKMKENQQ